MQCRRGKRQRPHLDSQCSGPLQTLCCWIRPRGRWAQWLGALVLCAGLCVLLLEGAYRLQWLDLYAKELRSFNPPEVLQGTGFTVLVFGDSFSAGNQSYVSALRHIFPQARWVNGGISDSGIREALLVAPRRFSQFRPQLMIYQIYVGNDLVDMGYHPDWRRLSLARNLWWSLSRTFPSLPYVRRRLAEARLEQEARRVAPSQQGSDAFGIDASEEFSLTAYTARDRQYYAFDPTVTDDSVRLVGIRREDFRAYLPWLRKLISFCRLPECQPIVFVVPHKAQVSRQYFEWERKLGAVLPDESIAEVEDYPFVRALRRAVSTEGTPVLNPLRFLREQEAFRHVYFVNDEHLNPYGQAKLAQWLQLELVHWLPQTSR